MNSEAFEQSRVVSQLRALGVCFAAVPNDAQRSRLGHVAAKRRGLEAGAPDLLIFTPPPRAPGIRGVAMEFKRADGGRVRPGQAEFLERLNGLGWATCMPHGAEEALSFLAALGYAVAVPGPSSTARNVLS